MRRYAGNTPAPQLISADSEGKPMSERHIGLSEFDKPSQHSFDTTCTEGSPLQESAFAAYGIKRHLTSEGTETAYPNGVTVTRFKEGDFSIGYPGNYKHHENKNGLSTISDKEGKSIAYLSADGNLLVPAGNKVLQENKDAKVSLNEVSCYKKEASAKPEHKPAHEQKVTVIEMPEMVIIGHVPPAPKVIVMPEMVITGRVPGRDKVDDKTGKTPKKPEPKPFNWDSDDPLEGIDVSGF